MTVDTVLAEQEWVRAHTGITMTTVEGVDASAHIRLALRINPKRAHLLVSSVLGKHVPVEGWTFWNACAFLADKVRKVTDPNADLVVMGYAETAVGMGHAVAAWLECDFFQSTRHQLAMDKYVEFSEPHSHASEHYAYVDDAGMVASNKTVVLVDDEVSTGVTVANTIRALHAKATHPAYIVATFLDARTTSTALEDVSAELGVPVHIVSSTRAHVDLPEGISETAGDLLRTYVSNAPVGLKEGRVVYLDAPEPNGALPSSVAGVNFAETAQIRRYAREVAGALRRSPDFVSGAQPHVVGVEEDTFVTSQIAMSLGATFSSTTRSPIFPVNEQGYPVRWKHEFMNASGETRWAYNLPNSGQRILVLPYHTHRNGSTQSIIESLRQGCDTLIVVHLPMTSN